MSNKDKILLEYAYQKVVQKQTFFLEAQKPDAGESPENPIIAPLGSVQPDFHRKMERFAMNLLKDGLKEIVYYKFNGKIFKAYPPGEQTPQNSYEAQEAAYRNNTSEEPEPGDLRDDEGWDPYANPFG